MSSSAQILKLRDGRILGYAEYGDPRGKPLFYFHGWPSSRLNAEIYDSHAKRLHIRIIAPDRPGFGISEYKKDRTLLDWPDDVVALADSLGVRKFAIVGVSGGGPYAAACAYRIPRYLSHVGIVVGLGPTWVPGNLEGVVWIGRIGWKNFKFRVVRKISAMIQQFNAYYIYPFGLNRFLFSAKADRRIYQDAYLRKRLVSWMREAFRHGYRGPEQDLKLYTEPWKFQLRNIRIPVYLWYGADDRNVSLNMGNYYASQIQRSTLTIYPGEGHMVFMTHSQEILKILSS